MQCGAPVICSNSSSLPEVAGNAAILVDPRDEVALAEAIIGILTNPGLRRELVTLSIQHAGRFSWKSSAEKVVEAYRMALDPLSTT
jgi:glycosyltransferase involved in cell wall biosynthesis